MNYGGDFDGKDLVGGPGYEGTGKSAAEFNTDALKKVAELDAAQRLADAEDQSPTWGEQLQNRLRDARLWLSRFWV